MEEEIVPVLMEKLIMPVLLVIIGGIFGFLSSYLTWQFQMNRNKKNIA